METIQLDRFTAGYRNINGKDFPVVHTLDYTVDDGKGRYVMTLRICNGVADNALKFVSQKRALENWSELVLRPLSAEVFFEGEWTRVCFLGAEQRRWLHGEIMARQDTRDGSIVRSSLMYAASLPDRESDGFMERMFLETFCHRYHVRRGVPFAVDTYPHS